MLATFPVILAQATNDGVVFDVVRVERIRKVEYGGFRVRTTALIIGEGTRSPSGPSDAANKERACLLGTHTRPSATCTL